MTHPGQLLRREKLYAGKEMGQNFLSNPNTARTIIERTGISGDSRVLEIGPGLGALTVHIARKTRRITAVEKDRRLVPLLKEELADQGIDWVNIINQDILKADFQAIAKDKKLVVIGNLPYNISSQILLKLVKQRALIEKAFLMFQKELADRIVASPGVKAYSRLSAIVQYASRIGFIADVGPSSFFPRPDVDSTVLSFDFLPREGVSEATENLLFGVIKAAFSKRRKSLKNSMVGGDLELTKPVVTDALIQASIAPERRAETLSVQEFLALTRALKPLIPETQ